MKKLVSAALVAAFGLTALASPAMADPPWERDGGPHGHAWGHRDHDEDRGREWHGRGWHRGDRFDRDEWRRYRVVDYRYYHLRRPPYGYEWREVDGRFILAAVASGIIADIILNGH